MEEINRHGQVVPRCRSRGDIDVVTPTTSSFSSIALDPTFLFSRHVALLSPRRLAPASSGDTPYSRPFPVQITPLSSFFFT
jgi:hypothetical protein